MCFSAEADVVVGVVVTGVGIDAVRHVTTPRQWPLAALPLVFGVHQLVEAAVWWGLGGPLDARVGRWAAWVYLLVAFVLPVLVPVGVARIEPDTVRRRAMWAVAVAGAVVSGVLVGALAAGGPVATVEGLHIAYSVDVAYGTAWTVAYVAVTCGAFLASSDRHVRTFGVLNLAAVAVLAWWTVTGVISLWCAWAAVGSVLIDLYLRAGGRRADASTPAPSPRAATG